MNGCFFCSMLKRLADGEKDVEFVVITAYAVGKANSFDPPKCARHGSLIESAVRGAESLAGILTTARTAVDDDDPPDKYCDTAPDGSCTSTDTRCMHNRTPSAV